MNRQKQISLPAIGGSSLLVIFTVLCLVVFALLSLNTALAEKRLSEAYAQKVKGWYAADLLAQETFAKLRSGETVPEAEHSSDTCHYSVPVSLHQSLYVTVRESSGGWEVISWRTVANPQDGNTTLPVWQGSEG